MTAANAPASKPVNCRPGEIVTLTGDYFCSMCTQNGPIGHVSLSRGVSSRSVTRKHFTAGDKFDNSCPEHGAATGWTLEGATVTSEMSNLLFEAIGYGNPDIIHALIDKGVNINARKPDGTTPLMCAVLDGYLDIIHVLLNKGADVNARKCDGTTALMIAALAGNVCIVRLLLEAAAAVNMKKNDCGTSALEIAATMGHTEVVRSLVEQNADINAVNFNGQTALTCAKLKGHMKIVELLQQVTQ